MERDRLAHTASSSLDLPLETKLWRLSMIIAAARRIHSSLTLDRVLDVFLEIAIGEVGAFGGSIYLRSSEEEPLVFRHSRWPVAASVPPGDLCARLADEGVERGELFEEILADSGGSIVTLPLRDASKTIIGVLQISRDDREVLDGSDRLFLTELSHFASLSITNAKYHEDSLTKAHLDSEIAVAREIQVGTLPRSMPELPGYDIAGFSRPAEETSGDSFDLIANESGGLTVLLADATGHGIGPALSVTQVRSMLRVARRCGVDLADTLKNINDQLCDDLAANRFVTTFIGHLDVENHRLSFQSAGQAPMILYRENSEQSFHFEATCVPLGLFPMSDVPRPGHLDLESGDTFALMTDGVFEAENKAGEMLGEQPVIEVLRDSAGEGCEKVVERILELVETHRGDLPQADDITIVLLRRTR